MKKKNLFFLRSSCERQHQNVSASEIHSCPRFNLFITQRMSFSINFPSFVILLTRKTFLFCFHSLHPPPHKTPPHRNMVALPNLTKEGYRILSYRLKDYNPSHIIFGDGVKVRYRQLIINALNFYGDDVNKFSGCLFFSFFVLSLQPLGVQHV